MIFTKKELQALVLFASKDETRSSCHGIIVDGADGLVAATDGHAALVCERKALARFGGDTYLIPCHKGSPLGNAITLAAPNASIDLRDFGPRPGCTPSAVHAVLKSARKCESDPAPWYGIGTPQLERLGKASKLFGSYGPTIMAAHGELDPIIITFDEAPEWTVIQMPLRVKGVK